MRIRTRNEMLDGAVYGRIAKELKRQQRAARPRRGIMKKATRRRTAAPRVSPAARLAAQTRERATHLSSREIMAERVRLAVARTQEKARLAEIAKEAAGLRAALAETNTVDTTLADILDGRGASVQAAQATIQGVRL